MEKELKIILLNDVEDFILKLLIKDQQKISGAIENLRGGKFELLYLKQLKGDIKELRVKKYRLIFFIYKNTVYFTRVFLKKTNKTPKNEIDFAEKCYKLIINN